MERGREEEGREREIFLLPVHFTDDHSDKIGPCWSQELSLPVGAEAKLFSSLLLSLAFGRGGL